MALVAVVDDINYRTRPGLIGVKCRGYAGTLASGCRQCACGLSGDHVWGRRRAGRGCFHSAARARGLFLRHSRCFRALS